MTGSDPLMAVAGALTGEETERILAGYAAPGSPLHGAAVPDLLEAAADRDSFADVTEPFCGEHAADLPAGLGTRFAVIAVCLLGEQLTVMAVRDVLRRAGLLLSWELVSLPGGRAGYRADGSGLSYLVCYTPDGRVVLCRWARGGDPAGIGAICEAVGTSVEVASAEEGRQVADAFERGEGLGWAVTWQRP